MASDLLAWYAKNQRRLPWRRTRDSYAIWVSEVMLQQTRVEAVAPYYGRWLRRFPTVERLARARPQQVLAAWEGLGYYRRALQLRRTAQAVVRDHGGTLPRSVEETTPASRDRPVYRIGGRRVRLRRGRNRA
jgi:A/G-specific adenine glycosylase